MPPTIMWAVLGTGLSIGMLVWVLVAGPDLTRRRVLANLTRGLEPDGQATSSLTGGEGEPSGLAAVARRLTPAGALRRLDLLHSKAGRPATWPLERLLTAKIVLPAVTAVLTALASSRPLLLVMGVAVTVACYFLPELMLYNTSTKRNEQIALELADTIDQMMIAVEAGLGFDGAMARVAKNGHGPLAEELVRTLQDIQLGQSRREAYGALTQRTGVPDLRRFIRAVLQAEAYGVAVVEVLRTQAAELRLKRRQRAEEKAMQIPVKVIFPLMLCILPVLFIVLLGPLALNVMQQFG